MSKQPIMVFTPRTLKKCLKYWKKKLFLTDWTIQAKLVSKEELNSNDIGVNTFTFVDRSSLIRIAVIPEKDRLNYVGRICDECTLVHELLHLKYNLFDGKSFEKTYVDIMEHQKLEQLAKTLIMVKYNLSFKWFDNSNVTV